MASLANYLDPEVIQQVARLDLRARFIVEGFLAGLHSSPFQGFSVEFSEHRKYAHGDAPRTIDWKVFARSDRLFVRKYQAETHLACHLLVDASGSMGYVGYLGPAGSPRGGATGIVGAWPQPAGKLIYVIHIAAALGYLVIKQQDAVGLGIIGERLETLLPARARRAHLVEVLAALSAVVPRGRTGLARGVEQALARISHRRAAGSPASHSLPRARPDRDARAGRRGDAVSVYRSCTAGGPGDGGEPGGGCGRGAGALPGGSGGVAREAARSDRGAARRLRAVGYRATVRQGAGRVLAAAAAAKVTGGAGCKGLNGSALSGPSLNLLNPVCQASAASTHSQM